MGFFSSIASRISISGTATSSLNKEEDAAENNPKAAGFKDFDAFMHDLASYDPAKQAQMQQKGNAATPSPKAGGSKLAGQSTNKGKTVPKP